MVAAKVESRNECSIEPYKWKRFQRELTYCTLTLTVHFCGQLVHSYPMAIVALTLSFNSSLGYVQQPYQQYPLYPPAVPANWPMYPHPGYPHHGYPHHGYPHPGYPHPGYPHPGSQFLPHQGYYGQPTPYQFPPAGSSHHASIPPQHHTPGPQVQGPSFQGTVVV